MIVDKESVEQLNEWLKKRPFLAHTLSNIRQAFLAGWEACSTARVESKQEKTMFDEFMEDPERRTMLFQESDKLAIEEFAAWCGPGVLSMVPGYFRETYGEDADEDQQEA